MINQCINTDKLMKILVNGIMIDNQLVIRLNPFILCLFICLCICICLFIYKFWFTYLFKYNFVFYKEILIHLLLKIREIG
jgi:hypothetical protein